MGSPVLTSTRWRLIDCLRGFALLGIVLVNSLDITSLGTARPGSDDPVRDALYFWVQTRFVPIFAFLFGMSLWFVLVSARRSSARPWLVLLRRLGALAATGLLLGVVYPGNILTEYAIYGLVALGAVLAFPRSVVLALGLIATAGSYALFGGGEPTTLGFILLGAGAAAFGLPAGLDRRRARTAAVLTASALAAIPGLLWQTTMPGDPRFTSGGIVGLVLAVVYVTGLALLWQTPVRAALLGAFEPLGRMALSNYIGAAVVFALGARLIDFSHTTTATPAVVLSLAVIAVQSVTSRIWLHHFRYGPFEWIWRTFTWWQPIPIRQPRNRTNSRRRNLLADSSESP